MKYIIIIIIIIIIMIIKIIITLIIASFILGLRTSNNLHQFKYNNDIKQYFTEMFSQKTGFKLFSVLKISKTIVRSLLVSISADVDF